MSTLTSTLDTTALSTAIESRDADGIVAWYEKDATLTVLDRDHTPAAPAVYQGVEAIAAYYRDVCGRNMQHRVSDVIATPDGLAFTQQCKYPDGAGVLCATVAHTHAGKIRRQTAVQVWDA